MILGDPSVRTPKIRPRGCPVMVGHPKTLNLVKFNHLSKSLSIQTAICPICNLQWQSCIIWCTLNFKRLHKNKNMPKLHFHIHQFWKLSGGTKPPLPPFPFTSTSYTGTPHFSKQITARFQIRTENDTGTQLIKPYTCIRFYVFTSAVSKFHLPIDTKLRQLHPL